MFIVAESNRKLIAVFVPTLDSNLIQASPESTKVSFTWEKEADAASYKLTVYEDAAMTIVVGSQSFDTNGNILITKYLRFNLYRIYKFDRTT